MESHDYYARINGKDYPIAWGFQIMEELGETLDSGSITIPHIFGVIPLKPYDDVMIHDYLPNVSPEEGGLPNRPLGKIFTPEEGHFYKHMVVASYTREKVNLADEREKTSDDGKKYFSRAYNYRIQLKSETCKLETVQLPNRTITQPMSLADSASDRMSASFKFGGETKKYTLPYNSENSSAGKAFRLIERVVEATGQVPFSEYTVLYAYINDNAVETADYSAFMSMVSSVSEGEFFVLPDWAISGVTTSIEQYNEGASTKHRYYDDWLQGPKTYHPRKHWIIRKLNGKSNKGWEGKDAIVARIKAYLSGTKDSEIVNGEATDRDGKSIGYDILDASGNVVGKDIVSSAPITTQMVILPNDSYIIYLYCDPEIVQLYSVSSGSEKANLYGTTDNSNGTSRPTKDSEFLCAWGTELSPFVVGNSAAQSKGTLTVYEAIRQAVELYSPYIKAKADSNSDQWQYKRKLSIGDDVKAIFSSVAAPENQWNCPNLRDYITRLMYVKDCIPVVHDNVIGCMNLSKRGVIPFDDSKGLFGIENYAMDGNSYCDRLIRTYNDGLSKDNVISCVERVGFRNSDSPTLTLDNLRLELSHPIYRMSRIYMCYYNTMSATGGGVTKTYSGVIKHDITPLVILSSKRNLLSEDWASLNVSSPKSIGDLARFKYATIGYDVGSRHISGWGAKYSYPSCVFWSGSKTVIENILSFSIKLNPYGSQAYTLYGKLQKLAGDGGTYNPGVDEFVTGADNERKALHSSNVVADDEGKDSEWSSETATDLQSINLGSVTYGGLFSNLTEKLKSLFFIVEYEGYVSASVMASKDFHDGDVVSRDNASSSLSFVESDGANQKEKVNRLGNAIVTQPVRYANREDIEELAQVWDGYSLSDDERDQNADVDTSGREKEHDDEVLYQRKMIFERDFVQVSYTFCRNYVLRNYFTSVFAKRRPFALASYEESVERQENKTIQLRFSSDSAYYQSESASKIANYFEVILIPAILSFYKATGYDEDGDKVIANGIDSCYYMVFPSDNFAYAGQCGVFSSDCQKFTSGSSACFTTSMQDSVSAGVFVSDWNPTLGSYIGNLIKTRFSAISGWKNGFNLTADDIQATEMLTGSKQNWLMFPVDPDTGELYSVRFGVGFKENDYYAVDNPAEIQAEDAADYQLLPLMDVAIKSVDGTTYTWFGKVTVDESTDTYIGYGHGAPRLDFKRNSSLYGQNGMVYRVDFSNASLVYLRDDWVHEWNMSQYSTMFFGDGKKRDRQVIREFLSAKFVGRETESSEETDTCVFKDGKERMSVTMQIEPVSEDNRVLFSDRMMKLSDAIGGYEKNYEEVDLGKNVKAIVGMTIRKFRYVYIHVPPGGTGESFQFNATASIPSISILVPKGAVFEGLEVNKSFAWVGSSSSLYYTLDIKKIVGIDSEGNLLASCTIHGTDTFVSENILFRKNDSSSLYIKGRTGQSVFHKDWVLFLSHVQAGYDSYSMVEDAFFKSEKTGSGETYNAVFSDDSYVEKKNPGITTVTEAGSIPKTASGSFIAYNKSSATGDYPPSPLGEGSSKSLIEETMGWVHILTNTGNFSETWDDVSYRTSLKEPEQLAKIQDKDLLKAHNMFWVKAPLMGSRETSWDVRTSLEDSEFDVVDGIMAENEKIIPYTTLATLTCRAKSSSYTSTRMSIPQSFVNEAFDQDAYEIESVSLELASYELSDNDKLKISSISINDYGNGSFNVIGQGYAVSASAMTASPSVTLNIKVKAKKRIPISVEQDSRGLWRLKIVLEEPLTGERSIRLYYKEGREYHFVFGANLGAKADEGKSADVIYPSDDAGKTYYIYVSVLDDRSKTVIDAVTGDPSYKVVNWLDDAHKDSAPRNACVKKS